MKLVFAGLLAVLVASSAIGATPVAHFKMNDNAASTVVAESLATNNASLNANTSDRSRPGKVNTALEFGAADGWSSPAKTMLYTNTLSLSQPFSFSLWFRFTGSNNWSGSQHTGSALVFSGSGYESTHYNFGLSGGFTGGSYTEAKPFIEHNSSVATATCSNLFSDTAWHHLVYSIDMSADIAMMWSDGVLVYSNAYTCGGISSATVAIGYRPGYNDFESSGKYVDDVRQFSGILTSAEVAELYNSGNGTEAELGAGESTPFLTTTNSSSITIVGCRSNLVGAVTVPDTINGYPVVIVGTNVFYTNTAITSVSLGANITSLYAYAFYGCAGVTGNLAMPRTLLSIGSNCFDGCSGLTSVVFPAAQPECGVSAFSNMNASACGYYFLPYSYTNALSGLAMVHIPVEIPATTNVALGIMFGVNGTEVGSLQAAVPGVVDENLVYHEKGMYDGSQYHDYGMLDSAQSFYAYGAMDSGGSHYYDAIAYGGYVYTYGMLDNRQQLRSYGILDYDGNYGSWGLVDANGYGYPYSYGVLDYYGYFYYTGIVDSMGTYHSYGIQDSSANYMQYGVLDSLAYGYNYGVLDNVGGWHSYGIGGPDGTFYQVGIVDANGGIVTTDNIFSGGYTYGPGILDANGAYYTTGILDAYATRNSVGILDGSYYYSSAGIFDGTYAYGPGILDGASAYNQSGLLTQYGVYWSSGIIVNGDYLSAGILDVGQTYHGAGLFNGVDFAAYGIMDLASMIYTNGTLKGPDYYDASWVHAFAGGTLSAANIGTRMGTADLIPAYLKAGVQVDDVTGTLATGNGINGTAILGMP